jgi:hypothetical protein
VLSDDHGQRVQMSTAQLRALVDEAKHGGLDDLVAPPRMAAS